MSKPFPRHGGFLTLTIILTTLVTALTTLSPPHSRAAMADGTPSDSNIYYAGHWDTSSPTTYTSYYGGAYFKTQFTGTTVQIKLADSVNMYVQIDNGADVYYQGVSGTINLTPTPLTSGTHTLRVAARNEWDHIQFQGLILDDGATTLAPVIAPHLIEFVGDSITAGLTDTKAALSDYAWLTGEQLGVEHTQIAFSGICLTDQCNSPTDVGMSSQFFKEQTVLYPNSPDWDFSRYQPTQVVINLGTNDNDKVSDEHFKNVYITFLQNIRQKYPQASLFAMETFLGIKDTATRQAVEARNAAGDANVYYIDTTGWLDYNTPDYNDGAHPSDAGQAKVAERLVPVLAAHLPSSLPSPWQTQNIGSVGQTGSVSYTNQTFTVTGSGNDIWNTSDAFRFVSQPLNGDGSIVARVASQQQTNSWAKAGVMIRENLTPDSTHSFMAITPDNGTAFQGRVTTGDYSSYTAGEVAHAPYWVKLTRSGNTFTGSVSADGTNWNPVGSLTISMKSSVYIGLAVTSHDDTTSSACTFDHVQISASSQGA